MATKKDLVEAYSFSRRRLVTAFVSGAPGGREVEPSRPGRTVVGGLALAVLLVAGAAIAGVFDKRTTIDWEEPGLVIDDDTGALYVILADDDVPGSDDPDLRSVVNVTSAQLILGDLTPIDAPSEDIADRSKGPAIGIVDAPATVPETSALINQGWTACTGTDHGVRVDVAESPAVTLAPAAGLVVRNGRDRYLIAEGPTTADGAPQRAYSYRFPRDASGLYDALGVVARHDAVEVPDDWLRLFPEGGKLDASSFDVDGIGERAPASLEELPRKARVGDYFVEGDQPLMVVADGYARLDEFSMAVLAHSEFGRFRPQEIQPQADVVEADSRAEPYTAATWPRVLPEGSRYLTDQEVCAVQQATAEEQPGVTVGLLPEERASAQETVTGDPPDVNVEPGHGAMVWSGGWHSEQGGSPVMVDDRGIFYPLRMDGVTVDNLGYGSLPETVVPDTWVELFDEGVELSREDALCPPLTATIRSCE
ncbi:MAG TPA: type VII secretion protein EccB [Nocardioides sp.]|nr:type VII secretion protein EccB [Nocardioides sp.]